MNFSSKKDDSDFFSLIDNDNAEEPSLHIGSAKPNHTSALTPEEVLSSFANTNASAGDSHINALEALKKRMLATRIETAPTDSKTDAQTAPERPTPKAETAPANPPKTEQPAKEKSAGGFERFFAEEPAAKPQSREKKIDDIIAAIHKSSDESQDKDMPAIDKAESNAPTAKPTDDTPVAAEKNEPSLLEKCRPFILDDKGGDSAMHAAPTYHLDSVAEILNNQSQKTLSRLSEKYEITFDDLGKYKATAQAIEESPEPTVFEDKIPNKKTDAPTKETPYVISDLDGASFPVPDRKSGVPTETATIKFTPVSDSETASHISVSSLTKNIDLTGELSALPDEEEQEDSELHLEQTEFEDYTPPEEYEADSDAKHFARNLSLKKRRSFLSFSLSLILTLVLTFMKLPFMSGILLANTKVTMLICTVIMGIIILLNLDMFQSVRRIFSRRSTPDICAATASVTVLVYAIIGLVKNEITLDLILLLSFTLCVRALCKLLRDSYLLSNFNRIAGKSPKRAVKLIGDPTVTYAMAKNSIEGNVLAAAPQQTAHIDDYMKYATFGIFMDGKMPLITVLSVILSLMLGFACAAYYDGVFYGLYAAAAIQCITAVPVLFFIDSLPLYSAAKKLNRIGAVITGRIGAERLEQANAATFDAEDLFPSGTVTLHQLKVLSDNSIDDTLIRAASLTDTMNSTLAPLFKKIVGTDGSVVLPAADTVKYEDKMGISGWVDNKLLFIGNRTLMEAHGIEVPNVEIDRKILRRGFFPIYVASEDTACALLIVQYAVRPEIARELRRISSLGITMLINSSDPNMTEEMICDYMGLYEDSVKVMSVAGCHMYKNAVSFTEHTAAPAVYKGNPIGLAAILNGANRIKKSNLLFTVLYVVLAVLGTVLFTYLSFNGAASLVSSLTVLGYSVGASLLSLFLYLTVKP